MEDRSRAPYLAQDAHEVGEVVRTLNQHASKGKGSSGFVVRKKTYEVSEADHRKVDSWSMNDWDYKKPNLPTYARGIFTHANNGKPEIVVRGYNKFFNVGETEKTQWRNVEENTRGPYELSVKENGCIIFIGGLDDKTLLVTSKHSTGPRNDDSANHAGAGEQWLAKQLTALGKTKADLAKKLRQMNATAVAELCDDSFEEHVLEYRPENAGLYLHGINLNLPEFATYPGNLVNEFAEQWGFKKVQYVMKDGIAQVKPFLDEVAETGNYDGRDTEGFVIRCQARDSPETPWHDWFFKYKFEEPYLMYRQWREVTKAVIAGKTPKYKKHTKITEEYILYARRQLAKDPHLGKLFNQNHGIIAMRDGFLAEKGLKGHEIIQSEENDAQTGIGDRNRSQISNNVVLAPIATLGCGKTTVAIALSELFGWGHEQNDNIEGKGRPKRFALAITKSLAAHPAVIADRNNHQRRERAQLFQDVSDTVPDTTFVALHWVHEPGNYANIKRAMQKRVLARGDKHQTIHANSKGPGEIIGIMNGFLERFEPCNSERSPDNKFDLVIDLDVVSSSRDNLATIVHQLHDRFPKLLEIPSDESMDQAISYAINEYEPTMKHDLSKAGNKENKSRQGGQTTHANGRPWRASPMPAKPPQIEFFGAFLPAMRIMAILDAVFDSKSPEAVRFYTQLKATRRVQNRFHVTLMHKASASEQPEYWRKLNEIWHAKAQSVEPESLKGGTDGGIEMGKTQVQLEHVIWDGRLMTILVRLLDPEWTTVNKSAHITVGTASENIKPKESNDLLKNWMAGENENIQAIKVKGIVVLEATVIGMLSR